MKFPDCFKTNCGFIGVITFAFAIALQIQITLFVTDNYLGLRINLADIALPFLGVFVIGSLLIKRTKWPQWERPLLTYISVVSLVGVLSVAMLSSYFTNGDLSRWALINKYFGFMILISYLLLGGWLATNSKASNLPLYFTKFFCGFFILTIVLSIAALIFECLFSIPLWIGNYHWDGLIANRNTFMLVAIFSLIAVEVYNRSCEKLFPRWIYSLFWALLPFFVLFNASRTFWIIGGVISLIIFLTRPVKFIKEILPLIVIGSVLCAGLIVILGASKLDNFSQMTHLKNLIGADQVEYMGDEQRLIALEDGLELYQKSNPVIGSGLGSYREFQIEKRGGFINIIDFTALWLLVETGALGLFVFTGFFCLCLWLFYSHGTNAVNPSPFHLSLLFFLIAFAAASVLHEFAYTRYVWFLLGLGLVSVKKQRLLNCP